MVVEQALMLGREAAISAKLTVKQLHADLFVRMRVFEGKGKLIMWRRFLELKRGLIVTLGWFFH
jgi:hypothetical protein